MTIKNYTKLTREDLIEKYGLTERNEFLLKELLAIEDEVSEIIAKEAEK